MMSCRTCDDDVQENELFCPTCASFHDYPNVKLARSERAELEARFRAVDAAIRNDPVVLDIASQTEAVVNVSLDFAYRFLMNRELYAPYRQQVAAGTRRPALPEFDQERLAAEDELFGSASSVVYAALAGARQGLTSYGPVALRLNEKTIEKRASVLADNSYVFCRTFRRPLPKGYRATWDDRVMLAVIKLAETPDRTRETLRTALLFSEGDRETDNFIEIHIWGGFTPKSVARIELQRQPENDDERSLALLAANAAKQRGIQWVSL